MKKTELSKILHKYCDITNLHKTGLFLLDLPTGFGKTYEVINYIYEVSKTTNRKIIFLTNLKKNLPYSQLEEFFIKDGNAKEYIERVVFINSNVDTVIENLTDISENIPEIFRKTNEYAQLHREISYYNNLFKRKQKRVTDLRLLRDTKENIRVNLEPAFRRILVSALYKKGKTKKKRLSLIKKDTDFSWIPSLYPAVESSEKQIFFLSVNKFLSQNTPLVQSSYHFLDKSFLKDALIFVDEFDASKEVILNHIIDSQLEQRIDFVGLFEQIYASFAALELPDIFYKTSDAFSKSRSGSFDIKEVIQRLQKEAKEVNAKYHLTYSIKTKGGESSQNFLFHDYRYHTIVNGKKQFISLKQDKKAKINRIEFVEKKTLNNSEVNITELINALRRYINYFKKGVLLIAENYQNLQNENKKPTEDQFTFENALRTFLSELRIKENHQKYLIESIKVERANTNNKRQKNNNLTKDDSFYFNGFRFYDFEDNERHNTKSNIYITDYESSPERVLLQLCSTNLVIGMSATASVETVIGNYDLRYIRKKLRNKFYKISKDEQEKLKKIFDARLEQYVTIEADFINVNNVGKELRSFQFDKSTENQIQTSLDQYEDFDQKRYLRIARAFKAFITKDINSFLCFLNTHPTYTGNNCNLKVLELIFTAIIDKYHQEEFFLDDKQNLDIKKTYFVLNSSDFEKKLEEVKSRLQQGDKIFLMTTYQTLGAGQNIQYHVEGFTKKVKEGKIVQTYRPSDFIPAEMKDFDAVYLDKPTNLLVNLMNELNEKDVSKRIFQVAMLNQDKKIFYSQLTYEIKRTFRKAYYPEHSWSVSKPESYKDLYQTITYRNFVTKEIIQAIGRIGRTYFKNSTIYVYADLGIASCIKFFDTDNFLCPPEFKHLVELAQYEDGEEIDQSDESLIEIEHNNIRCNNWINSKLSNSIKAAWSDKDMKEWEILREMTLKYPTISKAELLNNDEFKEWQFIYLPMLDDALNPTQQSSYFYRQENDFDSVQVSFTEDLGDSVSQENLFLPELMKNEDIKAFFDKKGYATSFKPNDFLLSPQIYHSIYKGAIGEAIGKYLFEQYVFPSLSLKELPADIYERFDYILSEGIFIDFKFWREESKRTRTEQTDKITKIKIPNVCSKGYKFEKLLIVNILANDKYDVVESNNGEIIEIPYLINRNTMEIDVNMIQRIRSICA